MKNHSGKLVRASRLSEIARKSGGVYVVATTDKKVLESSNGSKILAGYKYIGRQCKECSTTFATPLAAGLVPHCICCGSAKTINVAAPKVRLAADKDLAYFQCSNCETSSIFPKIMLKASSVQHCIVCGTPSKMLKTTADPVGDAGGDMPAADDLDLVDTAGDIGDPDEAEGLDSIVSGEDEAPGADASDPLFDEDADANPFADDDDVETSSADPEGQSGPLTLKGEMQDAPEAGGGSSDVDEIIKRPKPKDQNAREVQKGGTMTPEDQAGPYTAPDSMEDAPEASGGSSDIDEIIKRPEAEDQDAREIQVGEPIKPEDQAGPYTAPDSMEDAPEAGGGSSDIDEAIKRPEAEDQDAREIQVGESTVDDPASEELSVDALDNTDEENCQTVAFVNIGDKVVLLADGIAVASLNPADAGENAQILQTEAFRTALGHTVETQGLKKACAAYGFKSVKIPVPIRKIVEAKVTEKTAKQSKQLAAKLDAVTANFQHALDISAAGFAKNYWRKTQDPLMAAWYKELSALGAKNPQKTVDRVFKAFAAAHMREVLALARELAEKPKEALNSIAEAIDLGSYLPMNTRPVKANVDDLGDGDEPVDEEDSDVENDGKDDGMDDEGIDSEASAGLDVPATASTVIFSKPAGSGKRQSAIASIIGDDTALFH